MVAQATLNYLDLILITLVSCDTPHGEQGVFFNSKKINRKCLCKNFVVFVK